MYRRIARGSTSPKHILLIINPCKRYGCGCVCVAPRGAERHGKVYPHVDESSRVESSTNLEIKDITDSVWSR
jgi:hypothetical protein